MTVERYAAKFIKLSHFGPHLILTEAKKASRFQKGLNERLRHHLIASGVDNYAESVKRAIKKGSFRRSGSNSSSNKPENKNPP